MAFVKAVKPKWPTLRAAVYAESGAGKTTLARSAKQPMVVIDADNRFTDQMRENDSVFFLSENPRDNLDIDTICALLAQNMPGSGVKTIVVDTATPIFETLMEEVEAEVDQIRQWNTKNPSSKKSEIGPHRTKATKMKRLRRALFGYDTDVLIIYHQHTHYTHTGKKEVARTISDIELARLNMSINMTLKVVTDEKTGRRGVLIERNRFGHEGITVWDDSPTKDWAGFWDKLQAEAYKGLTWDDMQKKASATPEKFASLDHALSWGFEQGIFTDVAHARNALIYIAQQNEFEIDSDPEDWSSYWIAEVERRIDEATQAVGPDKAKWPAYLKQRAAEKQKVARAAAKTTTEEDPGSQADDKTSANLPAEPMEWMRPHLPTAVQGYIDAVRAASNDKRASAAQIASLRAAIKDAAGWNGDAEQTLCGLDKVDWLAALLSGQASAAGVGFPAGAFGIVGKDIIKEMGGKTNAGYNAERVALVNQIAGIVDAAYKVYGVTQ